MIPHQVIHRKRLGEELSASEIEDFFLGFHGGAVPDHQMSALLMAICFQGLSRRELDDLVRIMVDSGETLEHPGLAGPVLDKHSTGGVGDKVSLILAPVAAELGMFIPMMSGRGLGHTGGTLDKLEAIPGLRTDLGLEELERIVADAGFGMIGQTERIAPLDRRLYALRNVTGTVPAMPLIAASIMSKKVAEGLDGLVLDVKFGAGAFLPDRSDARALAELMVDIGVSRGVKTSALLTSMEQPLGRMVGHALETREALQCLRGEGPDDLLEVVLALTAEMAVLGGRAQDTVVGRAIAWEALQSGRPLERFRRMVELQGGDPEVVDDPDRMGRAGDVVELRAEEDGYVVGLDPVALGFGVIRMGGGRAKLEDPIDATVGFELHAKLGDPVQAGELLAKAHTRRGEGELGLGILGDAYRIGWERPEAMRLIQDRVG